MDKKLYVIYPDNEPSSETDYIKYKYSNELFEWFYDKVKYFSFSKDEWCDFKINKELTRKDNENNGCRITLSDGTYIKFYEVYFLMEFSFEEWQTINSVEVTMSEIIDYFYSLSVGKNI